LPETKSKNNIKDIYIYMHLYVHYSVYCITLCILIQCSKI
jgi:hypothetical protein